MQQESSTDKTMANGADTAVGYKAADPNDIFVDSCDAPSECRLNGCGDRVVRASSNVIDSATNELELTTVDEKAACLKELQNGTEPCQPSTVNAGQQSNFPDGGWGWVIVACCFVLTTIVGGSYTAFAIMYVEFVELFDTSTAVAGWIGSIYMASGSILGIFFSVAVERYGSRVVCMTGSVLVCAGYIISSFATSVLQTYASYGILAGCGVGMMVIPSIVILQQYFDKRRAMATSLGIAGYSIGSLGAGPLVRKLLDIYALRGTLVILAGVFLQITILASLYRPPPIRKAARSSVAVSTKVAKHETNIEPAKSGSEKFSLAEVAVEFEGKSKESLTSNGHERTGTRGTSDHQTCCNGKLLGCFRHLGHIFASPFDFSLLRRIPFLLYVIAVFLMHLGIAAFFQHTPNRAINMGVDRNLVAWLPTLAGAATAVSRFTFGFVANMRCVDRMLQIGVSMTLAGAIQMATAFARTFEMMAVYNVAQGAVNGVFFCILSAVLADLNGVEHIARSMAIWTLSSGVGVLISVPFTGFLFDITHNYDLPFFITGIIVVAGGLFGIASGVVHRRSKRAL